MMNDAKMVSIFTTGADVQKTSVIADINFDLLRKVKTQL